MIDCPQSGQIADGPRKFPFRFPSGGQDMATDICHEPGNLSVLDGAPSLEVTGALGCAILPRRRVCNYSMRRTEPIGGYESAKCAPLTTAYIYLRRLKPESRATQDSRSSWSISIECSRTFSTRNRASQHHGWINRSSNQF
jgi:hypothetical protein